MLEINISNDGLEALYSIVRELFPGYSYKADVDHENKGFEKEDAAYSLWFELFANATNSAMKNRDAQVEEVFSFFSSCYEKGSDPVRDCIDTCYVENLFWRLPGDIVAIYWDLLPENLQSLCVNFHGLKPNAKQLPGHPQQ